MTWRRIIVVLACTAGFAACSSDDDTAAPVPSSIVDESPDESPDDGVSAGVPASTVPPPTSGPPSSTTAASPPANLSTPTSDVPPPDTDDGIAAPVGDEPTVLGPLGSTEVEFDTGGGTVQIGGGDVPDLVPATFPRPADLVVQTTSETADAAGFTGVSELGFDELTQLYRDGLPAAGYEVTEGNFIADTIAVFGFDAPTGTGEVVISSPAPGGGQSLIVTFER